MTSSDAETDSKPTIIVKALKIPMMPGNLKRSIVIAALKSSFSIYCNRNNAAIDVT